MDSWITIIITLLLSAFFSGMEIAFVSSNKLKIELDRNKGLFSAKILSDFYKFPTKIIGALLLGNNIALVIYGIAMAKILEPVIINTLPDKLTTEFIILISQTILSTLLILIAAEFIPKVIFRINPNSILNFFAIPVKLFYLLFYPIIYVFIGFSEFLLKKIFRIKFTKEKFDFSHVDLDNYVKEFHSVDYKVNEVKQEIQMFQNAIDFRNIKLRECMIPRTEIAALEENDTIEKLKQLLIETGHSKILIYSDTIDNIIGYIHSSDMFKNPEDIKSITRSISIVPETMLANNVLSMLINEHKSIAVVVDEFGGTSGIITIEDIIEEIFGEINDEFDTVELIEKQINEQEYIFSARLEIDYLNEKYKLNLPESDDYETLGGLIINTHESIPKNNDEIIIDRFVFNIIKATETYIEQVQLKISN
ncbi:MAG: hemolysin family protein [Bacteroidales bacterium]|nr:hemolysin family protein [Bacteroidales bacterium]